MLWTLHQSTLEVYLVLSILLVQLQVFKIFLSLYLLEKLFFDFRVHRSLFRWLYSGLDWELVCSLQYYCCDKSCWHNGLCLVWKWCTHCLKSVMILRLNKYTLTFSDIKFKIYILQLYKEIKLSCSLLGYAFLLEPKKY